MSFRYGSGINKPGFDPLAAPTSTTVYNLYAWGDNNYGQLGLGNVNYYSSPKQVGGTETWQQIAGGGYIFTAGIKNNGTLWSWGANDFGQLGLGNTTYYSSPKQIGALTNWLNISTGYKYAVAIKTDGTMWSWGRNQFGQLGLTTYGTNYSSPKQIGSLTTWSKVVACQVHVHAIKTDGTLWGWGRNNNGQLGLGNITNYSSPKQVGALTNWLYLCNGGYYNTLAIKTDGTLWTWGDNAYGQLGNGVNTTSYSSPKQVGALTTWASSAGGVYLATAIKTNGTLWAWGFNSRGQLGQGNTISRSSPVQVGALTNWFKTVNTGQFVLAVKTDGTLWSWGQNNFGQLGLGNQTYYSSPKQVGSNTTWKVPNSTGGATAVMLA